MRARTEAYGWAVIYGLAFGLSGPAWQQARAGGDTGWAWLFGTYTAAIVPVYFTLQWRELRG